WDALWNKLPGPKDALRMQLSRLFHYCSAQGMSPDMVDDNILGSFKRALITESIVKDPRKFFGAPQSRGTTPRTGSAAGRSSGSRCHHDRSASLTPGCRPGLTRG